MPPSLMGLPAIQLWGLAERHLIPLPSFHGGEGSSFPGLIASNDTVTSASVLGIKSGDSCVVIGYQIDELTHTWSAKWFVAYPTFILGSLVRCHH